MTDTVSEQSGSEFGSVGQKTLMISVFVIATCGLVYELVAGTVASYLLGDSVTQFSIIIGAYLFSMGIGSYLSRYLERGLVTWFIQIEILVGILGGCSALVLFLAFTQLAGFQIILYSLVGAIGILVGLEIPILLRILKEELPFRDLVSRVLSLDYLGALAASLLFPLWLVPRVGLIRTSLLFGIANLAVAVWAYHLFRGRLIRSAWIGIQAHVVLVGLLVLFAFSPQLTRVVEGLFYQDPVVHVRTTPYQRIVLTRSGQDVRLYLNGHLQFSSQDEYRYHEALVHPALATIEAPRRALVLGGGDGMAVREILRNPQVKEVILVELDPAMAELFRDHDYGATLNAQALRDPRVKIVHADAFVWMDQSRERFDLIVADFPDPSNYSVAKLYTRTFYGRLRDHLAPGGAIAIQSTSPLFARRSFWCIVKTIRSVGLVATPYHAYIPSFGEWGYVVATLKPYRKPERFPKGLRFLTSESVSGLFAFPVDMQPLEVEVNRLNEQRLVEYYSDEWEHVSQ
ncbi:MAG: polyamine aminopropyltransferase [Planctomycetota bacterium]|jgi:spermidine synthase|nr:polyamine aminopropyltransferase [Planctomycetota bacterium]